MVVKKSPEKCSCPGLAMESPVCEVMLQWPGWLYSKRTRIYRKPSFSACVSGSVGHIPQTDQGGLMLCTQHCIKRQQKPRGGKKKKKKKKIAQNRKATRMRIDEAQRREESFHQQVCWMKPGDKSLHGRSFGRCCLFPAATEQPGCGRWMAAAEPAPCPPLSLSSRERG